MGVIKTNISLAAPIGLICSDTNTRAKVCCRDAHCADILPQTVLALKGF